DLNDTLLPCIQTVSVQLCQYIRSGFTIIRSFDLLKEHSLVQFLRLLCTHENLDKFECEFECSSRSTRSNHLPIDDHTILRVIPTCLLEFSSNTGEGSESGSLLDRMRCECNGSSTDSSDVSTRGELRTKNIAHFGHISESLTAWETTGKDDDIVGGLHCIVHSCIGKDTSLAGTSDGRRTEETSQSHFYSCTTKDIRCDNDLHFFSSISEKNKSTTKGHL
ncbi:hypothetical protein PFISCL1PPCAC_6007, partial [Pristionchus fissidentatus]